MLLTKHLSRLATILILAALATQPATADRPNVLIVTVDDMSADSMATFGCKLADSAPNMDRLAREGMRFEFAHVQVGNCYPSRNVMWSGRYPHNNRVEGFYAVKDPDYPVLCDLMKEAGYFTAIRGKVSHSTPYQPYAWDLILDTLPDGSKAHIKDVKSYGVSTAQGIRAAKEADKPFCVMINVSDPHKPFYAQGKNGETIDDPHKPSRVFMADEVPVPGFLFDDPVVRKELAHYYSSVRRADDCVGGILQALTDSGEADNTCIVFLSDHGMPLPFAKTQLYHHSTRTPLVIRWPGVTEPGTVDSTHMVSAVDLLPTILDMAGIDHPQGFDGRSFAPLLRGERQDDRDYVFKVYNENSGASRDPMRAIQSRKYLYIFNAWSNGERVFATATSGTQTYRRMKQLSETDSAMADRHDLYQYRVPEELFDIETDPDCLHNLIDDASVQEELGRLRAEMLRIMEDTGDHMLDVFRQRDDAEAVEAYVQAKEAEAMARRGQRRQGQAATNRRRNLISVEMPETIRAGKTAIITVAHRLPKNLGTQNLHVTLKAGSDGKRLERQVVEITGTGTAGVTFQIPAEVPDNMISVAAFVGEAFETNLQHVQSKPVSVDSD